MKLWKRMRIGGNEWQVWTCTGDDTLPEGYGDCYGWCEYPESRIYIRVDMSQACIQKTLLHELSHASKWENGIHQWLQSEVRLYGESWEKFEENLTELESSATLATLRSAGLLNESPRAWPKAIRSRSPKNPLE